MTPTDPHHRTRTTGEWRGPPLAHDPGKAQRTRGWAAPHRGRRPTAPSRQPRPQRRPPAPKFDKQCRPRPACAPSETQKASTHSTANAGRCRTQSATEVASHTRPRLGAAVRSRGATDARRHRAAPDTPPGRALRAAAPTVSAGACRRAESAAGPGGVRGLGLARRAAAVRPQAAAQTSEAPPVEWPKALDGAGAPGYHPS
ncbi:hypothetical protein GCM10022416_37450 [Actinomadura keratinilytica]|uniref:Uncharacterized protein n=1 Tax=Actinomadura keratinilytica TaxID=547461 RepID=A0ABP7Z2U2_9ACTN